MNRRNETRVGAASAIRPRRLFGIEIGNEHVPTVSRVTNREHTGNPEEATIGISVRAEPLGM